MGTKSDNRTNEISAANIIRCARGEQKMTLRAMAEALCVTHSAVDLWEKGKEPEQKRIWAWITDERLWVRRMGLEIFAVRHLPIIENVLNQDVRM